MKHAYNAYVLRVLEALGEFSIPLDSAKQLCRENLNLLEKSYLNLEDSKFTARLLLSA